MKISADVWLVLLTFRPFPENFRVFKSGNGVSAFYMQNAFGTAMLFDKPVTRGNIARTQYA